MSAPKDTKTAAVKKKAATSKTLGSGAKKTDAKSNTKSGAKTKAKPGKAGDAAEAGDKPKLFGGSPEGQKVVITDVIDVFAKDTTSLKVSLSDLLKTFQKQDALSETNRYRKQYGNLKEMFAKEKRFGEVFIFDGDVVILRSAAQCEPACKSGLITAATLAKIQTLQTEKARHDLNTAKTNRENVCARCQVNYSVIANNSSAPGCLFHPKPLGADNKYPCCGASKADQKGTPAADAKHGSVAAAVSTAPVATPSAAVPGCTKTTHIPLSDWTANNNDVFACKIDFKSEDVLSKASPGDSK